MHKIFNTCFGWLTRRTASRMLLLSRFQILRERIPPWRLCSASR